MNWDQGVLTFPKDIRPKVNVIARWRSNSRIMMLQSSTLATTQLGLPLQSSVSIYNHPQKTEPEFIQIHSPLPSEPNKWYIRMKTVTIHLLLGLILTACQLVKGNFMPRLWNRVHCTFVFTFVLFLFSPDFSGYIPILSDIGMMVRVFANSPGDLSSIPGWVIPKTQKMVLDASLLNTRQYKVGIKGKVEQSRKRSSVLPYTSV